MLWESGHTNRNYIYTSIHSQSECVNSEAEILRRCTSTHKESAMQENIPLSFNGEAYIYDRIYCDVVALLKDAIFTSSQ